MNRRRIFTTAAAVLAMQAARDAGAEKDDSSFSSLTFDFAVLYYLNISPEATGLPHVPAKDLATGKPTGELVRQGYFGVLSEGGINVAELVSRAASKVLVSAERAREFISYAFSDFGNLSPRRCYQPRHVMVFYTKAGQPVSAIEVCLSCCVVVTCPKTLKSSGGNFFALASFIDTLNLPLGPEFPSLRAFETRHAEQANQAE